MELADIDWRAGEIVIRGKGVATNGFPCPSTWASELTSLTCADVDLGVGAHLRCHGLVTRHARTALRRCPSIGTKTVSPHVLRHTCAMRLLAVGSTPR